MLDEEELSLLELLELLELLSSVGLTIIVVLLSTASVEEASEEEDDDESGGMLELLESATMVVVWVSPVVTSELVLASEVVDPFVAEVTSSPQAAPSISADRAHKWVERIAKFLG